MQSQWQWTEAKLFTLSQVVSWGLVEYLRDFFETRVEDWATEDRETVAVATMMVLIQHYCAGELSEINLRELLELSLRQYTYIHRLRYVKLKPSLEGEYPDQGFLLLLLTSLLHLVPPQVTDKICNSRMDGQILEKMSRDQLSLLRLRQEELLQLGGYISSLAYRDWEDSMPVVELRTDDF